MKPLFINLLTKCIPNDIGDNYIEYKFDTEDKTEKITISWYTYPNDFEAKTELFVPFQSNKYFRCDGDKLIFVLWIGRFQYYIELNPIETNEVQHLIYQIFQQYQVNKIQMFKSLANRANNPTPKTTEQQFEAAQEAVAENVSE